MAAMLSGPQCINSGNAGATFCTFLVLSDQKIYYSKSFITNEHFEKILSNFDIDK